MEIIGCKNCGEEHIPFGSVSVNITLEKHSWCEHCRESKTEKQEYFFCSVKCLHEYDAKIEWEEI